MVTTMFQHALAVVSYIPPRCRYSAESPPKFTFALNVLFSFSATVTVANLYYNHPILNKLAADFDVSYSRVSNIPTLMQAGYAGGLLFLNPLGDVLRRRTMVLALIGITASFWVGLCVTAQFEVFAALSFLTSFFTIAPQIFLPLVAEYVFPHPAAREGFLLVNLGRSSGIKKTDQLGFLTALHHQINARPLYQLLQVGCCWAC